VTTKSREEMEKKRPPSSNRIEPSLYPRSFDKSLAEVSTTRANYELRRAMQGPKGSIGRVHELSV
jgi:hypothetical protein